MPFSVGPEKSLLDSILGKVLSAGDGGAEPQCRRGKLVIEIGKGPVIPFQGIGDVVFRGMPPFRCALLLFIPPQEEKGSL